jgi:diaminohydroxyphosphoribosylaminopyrimidine deaminase/5-amino-6-(5-phosphoribosylamino)uracil reductase
LIEAKVARVVMGCLDPSPDVNGNGVRMLREAGIRVDGPLLESEARQLIAPFLARVNDRRPYVTLKWAESSNGMVAGRMDRPVRITNSTSDRMVHELRARCDAIAVGTNTVLHDDPMLTARDVQLHRPLLRVVLSNSLKIALSSRLVQSAREHPLLIYCSADSAERQPQHVSELRSAGAELIVLKNAKPDRFAFPDVLTDLHARSVTHLLVEPGPVLARMMMARNQVDRVWIFRSPIPIEEDGGRTAARLDYPPSAVADINGDRLTEYLNPASPVFFASVPSADFVLASENPPLAASRTVAPDPRSRKRRRQ